MHEQATPVAAGERCTGPTVVAAQDGDGAERRAVWGEGGQRESPQGWSAARRRPSNVHPGDTSPWTLGRTAAGSSAAACSARPTCRRPSRGAPPGSRSPATTGRTVLITSAACYRSSSPARSLPPASTSRGAAARCRSEVRRSRGAHKVCFCVINSAVPLPRSHPKTPDSNKMTNAELPPPSVADKNIS